MSMTPNIEKARDYCLDRLKNELSPKLTYHKLEHTTHEVVPAADRLATFEHVSDDDRILLLTAAYYHDLGFIYARQGHELVSIELAEQILPEFGYPQEQVMVIRGIILATHIPQSPANLLERIMADADLDYFGQDNFWTRSMDLRQEYENYGVIFADEEWFLYQFRFISEHQYFTTSELSLREAKKQLHLREILKQLDLAHQNNKAR